MSKQEVILITGGTGFVGSHLSEELIAQKQNNIHVTTLSGDGGYLKNLLAPSQIHKINLTNHKAVFELIEKLKPTQIYHLAAISAVGSSYEAERETLENNIFLQLNLLQAVEKFSPQTKILSIGSALVYQPQNTPIDETVPFGPVNPYAVSKVMQDMLAYNYQKTHNLQIIRVRPFNHIGERQAKGFVIAEFASQIVAIEKGLQDKIMVGNLNTARDFSDVRDIVKAYILLMAKGEIGEVYNLGSGHAYTIQEMLDMMIDLAKTKITVEIDPKKFRESDTPKVVADNTKIKNLGWQETKNIKATLERILNFYRSQN